MRVKRIITTSIFVAVFFCISYFAVVSLSMAYQRKKVGKILIQAREAAKSLETIKTKGKTSVGPEYAIRNDGVIDYVNKRFFITQTQGKIVLSAIYYIDNTTYMYNGALASWIKFSEDLNMFGDVLDKEKLLSAFPIDFEGTGFKIDILGAEDVEGQPCYILQSSVADERLAKEFMSKFLGKFISGQMASYLEKNKAALEEYLEQYIKNSVSTQWISKDSFHAVKVVNKYSQKNDKGVLVIVENEAIYYDFNQPVNIELPEAALAAKLITTQDAALEE